MSQPLPLSTRRSTLTRLARALALAPLLALAACATDPTGASQRAILDQACATSADCPTGFACEHETEHGAAASFCQAEDADTACPAGYEREVEHGQATCAPHGGSDDPAGGDDGSGAPAPSGDACTTSADCAAGLECELEHGVGTCQAHGGH